jgi:NAD-dependent SIR2 family protein deacetylase
VVPASSNVSDCVRDVEREESDDDTPGLTQMLMKMMGISVGSSPADSTGITFVDLSKGLIDGRFRNIVFLVGAGISTAAGIPDFRSPGTGLYDNLRRFNLPHPTAVFSIDYFRENPLPFYLLSRDLMPSQDLIVPKAHQFMKICTDRGLVRRIYSQNIDDLERMAGIPDEILIQAHGAFRDCLCIDCGSHISIEQFKEKLHSDKLERELVLCTKCGGLIKPAIVFFGESLPEQFFQSVEADMDACDLMIIMGTSLTVAPVCRLPHMLDRRVPRVVINRDRLASVNDEDRDLLLLGDLEEQVASLISACKWDA